MPRHQIFACLSSLVPGRSIIGHRPAFLVSTPFHRCGIIESMAAYYLIRYPKFDPNITVHVLEVTAVAARSVSLV